MTVFFFMCAILAGVITVQTYREQSRMAAHEIPAQGLVTEVNVRGIKSRTSVYSVRFQTAAGQSVDFQEGDTGGKPLRLKTGDPAPVCYNPGDPTQARIWAHCGELDWLKMASGIGLMIGCSAMGLGAVMRSSKRRFS